MSDTVAEKENAIVELRSKVDEMTNIVEQLRAEVSSRDQAIKVHEEGAQQKGLEQESLQKSVQEKESLIGQKDAEVQQLRNELAQKEEALKNVLDKLASTEKCLSEKSELGTKTASEVSSLKEELEKMKAAGKIQEDKLKEQDRTIHELETKLSAQTSQFEDLLNKKKSVETESSHKLHEVNQKLLEMENVKQQEIAELQERLSSTLSKFEAQMSESAKTVGTMRSVEKRQQELECEKKELELRETEMQIASRKLQKEVDLLRVQLATKDSDIRKLRQELESAAGTATTMGITSETTDDDAGAQINFLNSIIADMQRKNDKLTLRIQALEQTSIEGTGHNASFEFGKRKPAPRVFCDICDEFDQHETEDCPKQCSDSPPESLKHPSADGTKERKLPPPRKYCEGCEVFGHELGECPDDETY